MKISIEKGLESLENHLLQKGHEIVSNESAADAYIYHNTPISQIRAKNFSPISSIASDPILLINAKDKSFDEIEIILSQKSYNKIF